jgi:MFS transporter, FHS family, glucose/mannose:H+ symporter
MRRRREILLIYTTALAQGLALVAFPAASEIFTSADFHNLSSSEYGSLFLPMVIAAILASIVGGPLARRWGLKPVLLAGLGANLLAMALLATSQGAVGEPGLAYAVLLLAMTALGLGFGATLTALNALAMASFPQRPERALTALHALLGTGTALAPLLTALVTGLGAWWALAAILAGVLGLLLAAGTVSALAPARARAADASGTGKPVALTGAIRVLGLFVVAGILYGIVETVFANWAVIYLREDAGVSVRAAGYALTAFWAMVTAGRLLLAVAGGWLAPTRVYVALPGLMIVAFLGVAAADGAAAGIAAFALAGLACSAFLPLSIGFAQACHRDLTELVSGVMVAAYLLGFGIGSYGLGPLREAAGIPLATLYSASAVLAILLMGIALVLARRRASSAASMPHPVAAR